MRRKPKRPQLQHGHPLAQGLVGAWLAYEGAGGTVRDLSGRGNDGTLQGATWALGPTGWAIDSGGEGDEFYVDVPDAGVFQQITSSLSIFFTVVPNFSSSTTKFHILIDKSQGNDDAFRLLSTGSGDFRFRLPEIGNVDTSGFTFDAGEQIRVAATWDGTTARVYLEGREYGSGTLSGTITIDSAPIWIGADQFGTSEFTGTIENTLLYSRALPASQIRALHADPYAAFRPVRRWLAVAVDVPFVPQVYTADVRCNPSPVASVRANPSPTADVKSNPTPSVEVKSG